MGLHRKPKNWPVRVGQPMENNHILSEMNIENKTTLKLHESSTRYHAQTSFLHIHVLGEVPSLGTETQHSTTR